MELQDISLSKDILLPLFLVIVGGGMSLVGSFFALHKNHQLEAKKVAHNAKAEAARHAFSGFQKLLNTHNEAANLKRHIDDAFDEASKAGLADLEPWAKVKFLVGYDHYDEALAPGEIAFLINSNNADLLNRACLIQRRVWNHVASRNMYNKLRADMDKFLLDNVVDIETADGVLAGGEVEGRQAVIAQLHAAKLTNLLGQMMQQLVKDEEESFQVALDFKLAAQEHFGDLFPQFKYGKARDDAK